MPYTPRAPILTLCDALVASLTARWATAAPDAVSREYLTDAKLETLTGRRVWVFPAEYTDRPAARAEDLNEYRVAVVVTERYAAQAAATSAALKEWADERVDFVRELIVDGFDFGRHGVNGLLAVGARELWTAEIDPVEVYDPALLETKKLFWSSVEFVFQEIS